MIITHISDRQMAGWKLKAAKVDGAWYRIVTWAAGKAPRLSKCSILAPYVIAALESNARHAVSMKYLT